MPVAQQNEISSDPVSEELPKQGFFARFKRGLTKTRQQFGDGIGRLLLGKKRSMRFYWKNWKLCCLVRILVLKLHKRF